MKTPNRNQIKSNTCGVVLQEDQPTISINLCGGNRAIIISSDAELVAGHSWYEHCGYARTTIKGRQVYMHRLIVGANKGDICDHRNGDRLDNRRCNLRLASLNENARNRSAKGHYLGVFRAADKWSARIIRSGKTYYLGNYETEELAAYAVDMARLSFDGDLPRPNVPSFKPDASVHARILSAVSIALSDKNTISLKMIQKVLESGLSNKYWANRLKVRLSVITALRGNISIGQSPSHSI